MVHIDVVSWEPFQQSREGNTLSLTVPACYSSAARFSAFSAEAQGLAARRPQRVALIAKRYGFECVFPAGYLESAEPGFVEIVDEMCALRTPPAASLHVDARLMSGPCPSLKAVRGSRGLKFHATLVASDMSVTQEGFAGAVRREFAEHYTGTVLGVRCAVTYQTFEQRVLPHMRVVPSDDTGRWFEDVYNTRQRDPSGHHLEIELWLSS
jgi:hypothetical protein